MWTSITYNERSLYNRLWDTFLVQLLDLRLIGATFLFTTIVVVIEIIARTKKKNTADSGNTQKKTEENLKRKKQKIKEELGRHVYVHNGSKGWWSAFLVLHNNQVQQNETETLIEWSSTNRKREWVPNETIEYFYDGAEKNDRGEKEGEVETRAGGKNNGISTIITRSRRRTRPNPQEEPVMEYKRRKMEIRAVQRDEVPTSFVEAKRASRERFIDLNTTNKMHIDSSENFKITLENSVTFNADLTHKEGQATGQLIITLDQTCGGVEPMYSNRQAHGECKHNGREKREVDKKLKRGSSKEKRPKRRRLNEAKSMAKKDAESVHNICARSAAEINRNVSRAERTVLLGNIPQLQSKVVARSARNVALKKVSQNKGNAATRASIIPKTKVHKKRTLKTTTMTIPKKRKTARRKSVAQSVKPTEVKRPSASAPAPGSARVAVEGMDESAPLSPDEQVLLAETINKLPVEQLGGVIQIIREAAPVYADDDEIDIEMNELDTKTQRKLLKHASKFMKKSRGRPRKKPKAISLQGQAKKPENQPTYSRQSSAEKPSNPTQAEPKSAATTPTAASFLALGDMADSDSDSDDESEPCSAMNNDIDRLFASDPFHECNLDLGNGELNHDEGNDIYLGRMTNAWNITNAIAEQLQVGNDDAWGAAREEVALAKAREDEKKAREEKLKAAVGQVTKQRVAETAGRSKELRAQRAEEEHNKALLKEQRETKDEETRNAAREAVRRNVQSVQQTVDLDLERDIMKQYEMIFMDKHLGCVSPAYDFGF